MSAGVIQLSLLWLFPRQFDTSFGGLSFAQYIYVYCVFKKKRWQILTEVQFDRPIIIKYRNSPSFAANDHSGLMGISKDRIRHPDRLTKLWRLTPN